MTSEGFRKKLDMASRFHEVSSHWPDKSDAPRAGDDLPSPPRVNAALQHTQLPTPSKLNASLIDVLQHRESCRAFEDVSISLQNLSAMLAASYGLTEKTSANARQMKRRAVPSAGSLYPLEVSLICRRCEGLSPGIYHYVPQLHHLEHVSVQNITNALVAHMFLGQADLASASMILVVSCELQRSAKKYGERAYRYALFEAGHVIQNVNLAATALGLGTCNIGGFFDAELADLLSLNAATEMPLYACAIGHAAKS